LKHRNAKLLYGSLFLSAIGLAGCSSSDQNKTVGATARSPQVSAPQTRSGAQKPQGLASDSLRRGQDKSSLEALRRGDVPTTPAGSAPREVYFNFDSYDLPTDARSTLKTAADWLKKNPAVRVELEGHCDERGTVSTISRSAPSAHKPPKIISLL
jgi:peptidoglycan-associated lipoprotein